MIFSLLWSHFLLSSLYLISLFVLFFVSVIWFGSDIFFFSFYFIIFVSCVRTFFSFVCSDWELLRLWLFSIYLIGMGLFLFIVLRALYNTGPLNTETLDSLVQNLQD